MIAKYFREWAAGKLFILALKIATPELIMVWKMALNGDGLKDVKAAFIKAIMD